MSLTPSSLQGCEARADEDDGAGGFLVVSLLVLLQLKAAGGLCVQAADLCPECCADCWTL